MVNRLRGIAMAHAAARRALRGRLSLEPLPLGQTVDPGVQNSPVIVRVAAPDRLREGAHRPHDLVGRAATHDTWVAADPSRAAVPQCC
jgi:hypothetical protein